MRRATAALLGTVFGTTLLVGAKYATTPPADTTAAPVDPAGNGGPTNLEAEDGGAGAGGPEATVSARPSLGKPSGAPVPSGPHATPSAGGKTTTAPPPPTGASCTTVSGNAVNVSSPGTGAVTVTIKVCGGTISTSTGSLSRSNWSRNTSALPALDSLTVQYYKTNISQIHYSGATLTSNAYQGSLRSAMGKAGI